jgi:glycosyltransferase involved in cell wall biosynthesis
MSLSQNSAAVRIGINAHLLSGHDGYRRAGIHHYIAQIINHLPPTSPARRYAVFTRHSEDLVLSEGMNISGTRWPTERRWFRILWEQLIWPVTARRLRLDLLHSMAFITPILSSLPTVVTVYDLSFIYFPERFPTLQRVYLSSQTRRSCQSARRIATISESGRQDVHRFFDVPLNRIHVIHPGVEPAFRPRPSLEIEAFRRRHQLPEEFILHVGTLQPRKNLLLLIEAFAELRRTDLALVLVGGKGWFYDEIFARVEQLGLGSRVRFTDYVPDEELPLWYNAAALLVFPSVYEGFGMPIVQAMACGTPVIAADTSAIPEVTGQAALLFDPQDLRMLTEHMANALNDRQLAATMRQNGLAQAQHFSWPEAGRRMADVYERALAEE